jgi:DedD protein
MDRQLKERLIGAAVLIAVAVIMVPEMFSGSGSHSTTQQESASDSSASGQIKTYHIDLQHRESVSATSEPPVQQPPMVADTHISVPPAASSASSSESVRSVAEASSASSSSRSSTSQSASQSASSLRSASSSSSKSAAPITDDGWAIQLGSFGAEATARQVIANAKTLGFSAHEEPVTVSGKKLYRVRVGPYPDRDAAQATLSKLKHAYPQASLVAPGH